MSRAFVKEDNDAPLPPPLERLVSSAPNLVTPRGAQLIEDEVARLEAALAAAPEAEEETALRRDLRYWIARHAEETGSPRANWILDNFDQLLPKFVKIFPHEYKRVLGIERQKAAAHG